MKRLLLILATLFALFAAGMSDGGHGDSAFGSNYNGWEAQGAIMCNGAHNGWVVWQPDGGTSEAFVCGFAYDPGIGLYFSGWGYVNSCPTSAPLYGYCWRWQD